MKASLITSSLLLCLPWAFTRARTFNGCPLRCPRCPPEKNLTCIAGYAAEKEKDFCGCCTYCLKREGETCGGPEGVFGKCYLHLFCDKSSAVVPFQQNPVGVCRERFPQPYNCPAIACFPEYCTKPVCKYGYGIKSCGCCLTCAQGLGDECSSRLACGKGLYCHEYRESLSSEIVGICKPWRPSSLVRFPLKKGN